MTPRAGFEVGTPLHGADLDLFGNWPTLGVIFVGVNQVGNWSFLKAAPSIYDVRLQRSGNLVGVLEKLGAAPQLRMLQLPIDEPNEQIREQVVALQQRNPQLHIFTRREVVGTNPAAESIPVLVERGWILSGEGFGADWSTNESNTIDMNRVLCVRRASARKGLSITDRDCQALLETSPHFFTLKAEATRNVGLLAEALVKCPHVGQVMLAGSDLSDAGLASLSRVSQLSRIDVTGTNVTEAGIEAFHAQKPGCLVTSDFGVLAPSPAPPQSSASRSPSSEVPPDVNSREPASSE